MKTTTTASCRQKRYGKLVWPLVIGLPILIILAMIVCRTEVEALSPDEIMAKENWSEEELKNALAHSMSPAMAGQRKEEIINHLDSQLKKFPAAQRDEIRRGAVVAAVSTSLQQIRKMPPSERRGMINTIQQKAEAGYASVRNRPNTKQVIASHLKSDNVEAFTQEVNRVIFSELTPEERVQFAPITKLWIKTMKNMGR